MGLSTVTYALCKKYTDETAIQFGGLKGAPCTIASIEKEDGRNIITFQWKNDEGQIRTSQMIVEDGENPKGTTYIATLLASGWNASNQQAVTFIEYEQAFEGVVGVPTNATEEQIQVYGESIIRVVSVSGNTVTFAAKNKPKIDLPVMIYCATGEVVNSPLPAGGTTGQVLAKKSDTDRDVEWKDAESGLPTGGTNGQFLQKSASGAEWADLPNPLPTGGTNGQVMTKTTDGEEWKDIPSQLPSSGTNGQFLKKTADGEEWSDLPDPLPTGGTAGQVMIKTNEGAGWSDFPKEIPDGGNNGQALKRVNGNAAWADVNEVPSSGTTGQFLKKTADGYAFDNLPDPLPSGGTTGQLLTKTTNGEEWADAPTELPSGGTAGQFLKKTTNGVAWTNSIINYSTDEHIVGTWINGKPIYEKTFDIGVLPGNQTVQYPHGIENLEWVVRTYGIAGPAEGATDEPEWWNLPKEAKGSQYWVSVNTYLTYIKVQTSWAAANTKRGYITLQYTKTTD